MSFADVRGSARGGPAGGSGARGAGASSGELVPLQRDIFQATTAVAGFKRLAERLGTAKDTAALRENIDAQRREISANAAATKDSLKALASASGAVGLSRADKVARAKLVADFQSVLKEFERASARAAAAAQSYAPREEPTRASAGAGAGEGDPLLSAAREAAEEAREREEAQQEQQLEHNTALLEEREEGIADIAAQIGEVNEIFTDLATLVNEQGAMVDDIEANMVATQEHTAGAEEQLIKARRSQGSFRRKAMCMCLVLLAAFVTLLVLTLKK